MFETRKFWNFIGFKNILQIENFNTAKIELLQHLSPFADTSVFMDVGANVGQSLVAAHRFNPAITYFGFEPNPIAFSMLSRKAQQLGVNATLLPWACAEGEAPLHFYASSGTDAAATVRPDIRQDTYGKMQGHWAPAYSLDGFHHSLPLTANFIMKVDTEGAEQSVLKGASTMLRSYRPAILCEVLNAHSQVELAANNADKTQLEQFLQDHGYHIYHNIFDPADKWADGPLKGLKKIEEFPKDRLYRDFQNANDYLFWPIELPDVSF